MAAHPHTIGEMIVSQGEREILGLVIDMALAGADATGVPLDSRTRAQLQALRARLAPTIGQLIAVEDPQDEPTDPFGLTRAQEHAGDAMAAKYGRSGVERQADGAVVITGLLDDIVMETVCIETDGRERWRR